MSRNLNISNEKKYIRNVNKDDIHLMRKLSFLFLILLPYISGAVLPGSTYSKNDNINIISASPDSLRERQMLFNGAEWKNQFRRIEGDQFLFVNYFLPGSVSLNGKTFNNIQIKYDIFSDELLVPRNLEQIVCLNKEMVDSFKFVFDNTTYRFKKINENSSTEPKGYVNVLYEGKSTLFVKYEKRISTEITNESDGEFYLIYTIYFVKNGVLFPLKGIDDIYSIVGNDKTRLQNFVSENKLKVNRKVPASFVPVIRFYDSIINQ